MTQDEIIRMAREAGMDVEDEGWGGIWTADDGDLERFAVLVAEATKESEKKWVGLTEEEYEQCCQGSQPLNIRVRMVAMALKNKNTGA